MKVYKTQQNQATQKQKKYETQLLCHYNNRSRIHGYCFEHQKTTASGSKFLDKKSTRHERRVRKNLALMGMLKIWRRVGTSDRIILTQKNFHLESELHNLIPEFHKYTLMYQEDTLKYVNNSLENLGQNSQIVSDEMSEEDRKNVRSSQPLHYNIYKRTREKAVVNVPASRTTTSSPKIDQSNSTANSKQNISKPRKKYPRKPDPKIQSLSVHMSSAEHELVCGEKITDEDYHTLCEKFDRSVVEEKYKRTLKIRAQIRNSGHEDCEIYQRGLVGQIECWVNEHYRLKDQREQAKAGQISNSRESLKAQLMESFARASDPASARLFAKCVVCGQTGMELNAIEVHSTHDSIIPRKFLKYDDPNLIEEITKHLKLTANYLIYAKKDQKVKNDVDLIVPYLAKCSTSQSTSWRSR